MATWVLGGQDRAAEKFDFVVTEKTAYAILPAEALPVAGVASIEWSPTGNFLLMVQETPRIQPAQAVNALLGNLAIKRERRLLSWNKATNRIQDWGPLKGVFGSDTPSSDFGEVPGEEALPIVWFPGSDIGILEWNDEQEDAAELGLPATAPFGAPERAVPMLTAQRRTRKIDLARGTIAEFRITGKAEGLASDFDYDVCPVMPRLVVLQSCTLREAPFRELKTSDFRNYVFTIDAMGQASPPVFAGDGLIGLYEWVGDGATVRMRWTSVERILQRPTKDLYFDARNNRMADFAQSPGEYESKDATSELEIRATATATSAGVVKINHNAFWLSATGPSEQPAALLSTTAETAALSPKLDRVAVLEKGVVTLRPLAMLNIDAWRQVQRQQAVQNAKQVGLGLLMYCGDFDDYFPEPGMFADGAVDPYLKDMALSKNFVYTFRGGSIENIKNPAETPLGYMTGPGGYALVFADGHVTWRDGKPPASQPFWLLRIVEPWLPFSLPHTPA